MRKIGRLLLLCLLLSTLSRLPAQSGSADSFDPDADGNVYAAAVQLDGRVLVAGDFVTLGGAARPAGVARTLPEGPVDATFSPAISGGTAQVFAVAALPDGRVLLAGSFHGIGAYPIHRLARLQADGTPDLTFSAEPDSHVRALVPLPDGRLLVLGSFTSWQGGAVLRERVARLQADGSVDPTFQAPANSGFTTVAALPDGRVLLGGFGQIGGVARTVVRLFSDGSVDPTFAEPGADSVVLGLLPQPDGRTLVAGQFTQIGGSARAGLARLLADGTRDPSFGAQPSSGAILHALALQADGAIVVGGDFSSVNATPRQRLARVAANGALDAAFDPNSGGVLWSAVGQSDGRIVVTGAFQHDLAPASQIGGAARNRIARLRNDAAPASVEVPNQATVWWNRAGTAPESSWVRFELSSDGGLTWTPLGLGNRTASGWQLGGLTLPLSGIVRAIGIVPVPHQGGLSSSLASGRRSYQFAPAPLVATQPATDLAAASATFNATVNASGTPTAVTFEYGRTTAYGSSLGATLLPDSATSALPVSAMATGLTPHVEYHYRIVATNTHGTAYGEDVAFVANAAPAPPTLSPGTVAENNPPGAFLGLLGPLTDADGDPVTYSLVAGPGDADNAAFTIAGNELHAVASFDREVQSAYALRVRASDGFANGEAEAALTVIVTNVIEPPLVTTLPAANVRHSSAALRATVNPNSNATSAVFEWGPTASYGQSIPIFFFPLDDANAHAVEAYVAGLTPGTTYHFRVSATNAEGVSFGADQMFVTRASGPGDVELAFAPDVEGGGILCVAMEPDGALLLGGFFTHVNGVPRSNLARLLPDGSVDPTFDPSPDNVVNCLAVDGSIYVGGSFSQIGGQARSYLARLGADGAVQATFHPLLDGPVEGIALANTGYYSDQSVVIVWGAFTTASGVPRLGLARLEPSGAVSPVLPDLAPDGPIQCVLIHRSGDLIVGGAFTALGGAARNGLAAVSSIGAPRAGYGFADPGATVAALALAPQGLLVGGSFTYTSGGVRRNLARLLDDGLGTLDPTFAADTNGPVQCFAPQTDGLVLVGGSFSEANGSAVGSVARLTALGALDASFDAGVRSGFFSNPSVQGVLLHPDGRVLLHGYFGFLGGEARPGLARLLNGMATSSISVTSISFEPFPYWSLLWQRGGTAPFVSEADFHWRQTNLLLHLGQGTRSGTNYQFVGAHPFSAGSAGGYPISYVGHVDVAGRFGGNSRVFVREALAYPPRDLAAWRLLHFGTSEAIGSAADEADPDGDGLPNLLEYALGTAPTSPLASILPPSEVVSDGMGGQRLRIRFVEPPGISGVQYGAEWSPALGAGAVWTPVPDSGSAPLHEFSVPVLPGSQGYLRLRVTREP